MIPKTMPKFLLFALSFFVVACGDTANSPKSSNHTTSVPEQFVGCYATKQSSPAQISITHTNGQLSMAMKEPDGGWDTPEPMQVLENGQAWEFFKVNALNLTQSDIVASIGRTDSVMTLGVLKEGLPAVNPHLDSSFVVSLFGAVNTIYRVDCDKTPVKFDLPENFHGNPTKTEGQ